MTRDISVFVKCDRIFRLFFFEITSYFGKVVRQLTEGMVGSIIMGFVGNLPGFPAVKEF